MYVHRVGDTSIGGRIGLARIVVAGSTLYGQPASQLREATRYEIVVTDGVNGQSGRSTFTTMTATRELREMVGQLDGGQAYVAAGIRTGQRGLDLVVGAPAGCTRPRTSPAAAVQRPRSGDERSVGRGDGLRQLACVRQRRHRRVRLVPVAAVDPVRPHDPAEAEPVGAGAPGGQRGRVRPAAPPGDRGPARAGRRAGRSPCSVRGSPAPSTTCSSQRTRTCATASPPSPSTRSVTPAGPATQSGVDLAGPRAPNGSLGFGRAVDVEGDGTYGNRDGLGTKTQPARNASVALRDGLRQTALDNMALIRAISRGVDVDADGQTDLRRTGVSYFAQSLGGIYGTMLAGADPKVRVARSTCPAGRSWRSPGSPLASAARSRPAGPPAPLAP